MTGFIQGADRSQGYLLPERIDEYVSEESPVPVIEAFVEELDLGKLGFARVEPNETGRPAYHPATLLKIYLYGYLNRVQSNRRLEQEANRNLELMWLTGRLAPDFKTLADFRADNGAAIRGVCREFIVLCRRLGMFSQAIVAIDGSKFKAVNHRDRNFTSGKMKLRMELIEQSITEYLEQLDRMDRKEAPRSVRDAEAGDAAPGGPAEADEGEHRWAGLLDRPRRSFNGEPRERNWSRWLQRADRRRC